MSVSDSFRTVGLEDGGFVEVMADRYRILLDGEDTAGSFALIECKVQPGSAPPPHMNHREDLTWYVLEGELTFTIGEEVRRVKAGECIFIPRHTTQYHTYQMDGLTVARALLLVSPAGFERFLVEAATTMDSSKKSAPAMHEVLEELIQLGQRYGVEIENAISNLS